MDACKAWLIVLKPFTSASIEIVTGKAATTVDEHCGLSPCLLVLREYQASPETGAVTTYDSQEEIESYLRRGCHLRLHKGVELPDLTSILPPSLLVWGPWCFLCGPAVFLSHSLASGMEWHGKARSAFQGTDPGYIIPGKGAVNPWQVLGILRASLSPLK